MSVSSFQGNQRGGDRHGEGSTASSPVATKDLEPSNKTNIINNENNYENNDANQRSRKCTQKGSEFFREESLKSHSRSHKAILKHVKQIEELLQCGNVEEASNMFAALEENLTVLKGLMFSTD